MNCKQAELCIQRSLDEALSPVERAALDAHLAECPDCSHRWREYRQLSRAAMQWVQEPVTVSSDFTFRLMEKIEERAAAKPSRTIGWLQGAALAGFAAATAGVILAVHPILTHTRVSASNITPSPQTLQTIPAQLWDSVRDFAASTTRLSGIAPTYSWILPVCLLALAANVVLIHNARRRTA